MNKKLRNGIIIGGSLVIIAGIVLAIIFGVQKANKDKEDLYNKGVQHLVDAEYKEATEIFVKLKNYKDSNKKYNYSFNLQRYEQGSFSYEELINYGMQESDSKAVVDFVTKGGSSLERKTITEKTDGIYITEVPEKQHYDFTGWTLNYSCYELSSDAIRYILESSYKDHAYTITFSLDGGTSTSLLPKSYYYNHGDVAIPNASKAGYMFLGYTSNLYEGVKKDYSIPNGTYGDVVFSAQYSPLTYTITFDKAPGKSIQATMDEDVSAKIDAISPEIVPYYTFECWTYDGEPINKTKWNIVGNVKLVGKYVATQYKLSYKLNGAKFLGLPSYATHETEFHLPNIEKENALFTGWRDSADPTILRFDDYKFHGTSAPRSFEANFVEATIENGVLMDISDKTVAVFVIPSYVNDISSNLISQLPNLHTILVSQANKHFSVDDKDNRVLVKDGHIAFACPRSFPYNHLTLTENIDEIGNYCFKGTHLEYIDGSALITKIGNSSFEDVSTLTDLNGFNHVAHVGYNAFKGSHITDDFLDNNKATLAHIGAHAFDGTNITKADFTSIVDYVGDYAFANLSGITSVKFYANPDVYIGNNIFDGSTNITSLETDSRFFSELIQDSLGDHSLTSITLKGNTNIEEGVYQDHTSLTTLDLSNSTISQIGSNAFKGNTNLKTVSLPSTIVRINSGAFEGCEKLDTFNFSTLSHLFNIGGSAFKNSGFTNLDFTSNSHLTIDDHAFTSSSKLTSIKLNHGQIVTRIGDVFDLCNKITSIEYNIKETSGDVVIPNFLFESLNNVTNITIKYLGSEDKLISLGDGSFKNCSSLTSITLTNCHIDSVPNHCFEGCSSLVDGSTFANLATYGEAAFYNCPNLIGIIFDTGLVSIGSEAFAGCYSLCSSTPLLLPKIPGEHADPYTIGVAAFADITGTINIDYTETAYLAYTGTDNFWYRAFEGYSGILTFASA